MSPTQDIIEACLEQTNMLPACWALGHPTVPFFMRPDTSLLTHLLDYW